ncbi:MAG TPA: helix-turn-helix domain-containing protein [Solirubrobacteraceae bacterium]|nr:helix-turn-helix domain-containing protein [Solirubrobacteraceae bacterium]
MESASPLVDRPWRSLPPGLADALRPELPELADETIAAIAAAIPEYARPLEGRFGRNVRRGVEQALAQFVALVGDPRGAERPKLAIYRELGAGEWRDGRSLDALQAAYRVGARVAWRRVGAAAARAGAEASTLQLLAESIFAYIDELSAASVAGYADAQSAAAGEREARRRALAELLLREPPAGGEALAGAARAAGWPVPRQLAAVLLPGAGARELGRLAAALGPDALALPGAGEGVVLVADPEGPGRREALTAALDGRRAAVGPAHEPAAAGRSLGWARDLLDAMPAERCAFAVDHLAEIGIAQGRGALLELARRRLAALDALPAGRRARLTATLQAWLRHRGSAPAVAGDLGVHPQTVRYRLAQLRELLGAALEDPQARFELELALRARAGG